MLFYARILMPYEINIHTDWSSVGPVENNKITLEKVYNTLYDFEHYKDWNTFTYDVQVNKEHDDLKKGDSATLKVNLRIPFT